MRSVIVIILLGMVLFSPLVTGGVRAADDEPPDKVLLVIDDSEKIEVFSSSIAGWISVELKMNERVIATNQEGVSAIAVTNFRALGFSDITGRWSEIPLELHENYYRLKVSDYVKTVVTDKRALAFNVRTGQWISTRLD